MTPDNLLVKPNAYDQSKESRCVRVSRCTYQGRRSLAFRYDDGTGFVVALSEHSVSSAPRRITP